MDVEPAIDGNPRQILSIHPFAPLDTLDQEEDSRKRGIFFPPQAHFIGRTGASRRQRVNAFATLFLCCFA